MPSERDARLIERLVDRQVVHTGTYVTFVRDTVVDSDNRPHGRDLVLHPGGATVVPLLPDGRVVLVRQYRHAAGDVLLELPAGTLDRLPDGSVEDPLVAARRELHEETGYRGGEWRLLETFFTAPGFATELMYLYLATSIEIDPEHDGPQPDERLEVEHVPFSEALAMAASGRIKDAKTLIGLYAVDAQLRAGQVYVSKTPEAR